MREGKPITLGAMPSITNSQVIGMISLSKRSAL
jgi:hypothetical protein